MLSKLYMTLIVDLNQYDLLKKLLTDKVATDEHDGTLGRLIRATLCDAGVFKPEP